MNLVLAKTDTGRAVGNVFAAARDRLPGAGNVAAVGSGGRDARRGHGASRGVGTPCSLARSNASGDSSKVPSGDSTSASAGAGNVAVSVKTKAGIFGQYKAATASGDGFVSHCSGSVGVAGCCGVAGTTWTMR